MSTSARSQRSILPGFGLSLGFTLAYLGLIVLIPLSAAFIKTAGMSWADAFMHMCTTMGLGGFSSHDASFAYWDSPLIEAVAIVFMTLAGVSFALAGGS